MEKWKITVIRGGTISADKSGCTHYRNFGVKIELPIWFVALTNGDLKVLIDTGMDDLEWVVKSGAEPFAHQNEEEQTHRALKVAMNWMPEEVDIVINTHLHYDHCGCNRLFKNADIYLQRRELEAAFNPPPGLRHLYAARYFDKNAVPYFQWKLLDGEALIAPGLLAFPTPGHSHGHQSVLVDTGEGAVCVTGDVANLAENIYENIETGIVVDADAVYKSFETIRRRAQFIIPGHEPGIPNLCEHGFPEV